MQSFASDVHLVPFVIQAFVWFDSSWPSAFTNDPEGARSGQGLVKYNEAQKLSYKDSMALSVVVDKAIVGHVDTLFAAIMDVFTGVSSWLPPQVPLELNLS